MLFKTTDKIKEYLHTPNQQIEVTNNNLLKTNKISVNKKTNFTRL